MTTIENIAKYLPKVMEGVSGIIPEGNGGIRIEVENGDDILTVLSNVADILKSRGFVDDLSIITNIDESWVYIEPIDRDEKTSYL